MIIQNSNKIVKFLNWNRSNFISQMFMCICFCASHVRYDSSRGTHLPFCMCHAANGVGPEIFCSTLWLWSLALYASGEQMFHNVSPHTVSSMSEITAGLFLQFLHVNWLPLHPQPCPQSCLCPGTQFGLHGFHYHFTVWIQSVTACHCYKATTTVSPLWSEPLRVRIISYRKSKNKRHKCMD